MAEGSALQPRMVRRAVEDQLGDVGRAVAWAGGLAADAGLPTDATFALELCLEEALANLIRHGRADGGAKAITVSLGVGSEAATVVVSDRCRPFDVARARVPGGPTAQDMFEGGQGLRLLHAFAAQLTYGSDAEGNHLTMVFRPAATAPGRD